MNKKSEIVYIAGPYSKGDVALNVRNAINVGIEINDLGHYAIIPHFTHFIHMLDPRPYEYWLELDLRILKVCDSLIRLPGESSGADNEVLEMIKLGKTVHLPQDWSAMKEVIAHYEHTQNPSP